MSIGRNFAAHIYMTNYKSADLNTGVIAFEIGEDFINVRFRDGSVYLYNTKSAGVAAIAEMKALAKKGAGLTTYINQHVKERYQLKLK